MSTLIDRLLRIVSFLPSEHMTSSDLLVRS